MRDFSNKKYTKSKVIILFNEFKNSKKSFNSLHSVKLIEYFKNQCPSDFKNSKKFWEFYSSFVTVKSDKSCNSNIYQLSDGVSTANNPLDIANLIDTFFINLNSNSNTTTDACLDFVNNHFDNIINNKLISPQKFNFVSVSERCVRSLLNNLSSSSGPGNPGISTKIFKK